VDSGHISGDYEKIVFRGHYGPEDAYRIPTYVVGGHFNPIRPLRGRISVGV